jgi:hypothetical protein
LEAPVEGLREYVRTAAVAHIDETSWWQGRDMIYRKLSGGTESEAGCRFVERMLSVVATCRQQEVNVLDHLTRCYQARLDGQAAPSLLPTTSTAQAA